MNFYTTYNQKSFSLQRAKSGILATEILFLDIVHQWAVRAHVFGLAKVELT